MKNEQLISNYFISTRYLLNNNNYYQTIQTLRLNRYLLQITIITIIIYYLNLFSKVILIDYNKQQILNSGQEQIYHTYYFVN